jgi:hypothetical protein
MSHSPLVTDLDHHRATPTRLHNTYTPLKLNSVVAMELTWQHCDKEFAALLL